MFTIPPLCVDYTISAASYSVCVSLQIVHEK